MKVQEFQIKFDTPQAVFGIGQSLNGQVILSLIKPLKLRKIFIVFEGRGKSFWDVKRGKSHIHYRARETYLNHTLTLCSPGAGDHESMEHPAGNHVYPFSVVIPTTLPSSFEGRRGYVRYICKATIDRPWKFDEHVQKPFTVIHPFDLNNYPNAAIPLNLRQEQTVQGFCCGSGQVEVKLNVNKSGFVPGEPIVYDIFIDNKTDENISSLDLDVKQIAQYTGVSDSLFSAGTPKFHLKKEYFKLLHEEIHPSVKKNQTHTINRTALIPSLCPSRLEGCNIIDITYFIRLKVPCGMANVKMEREILIGTIPIRDQSWPSIASAPAPDEAVPYAPPPYEEAPPSYAECVFGGASAPEEGGDEYHHGDTSWAPAYPYYNWTQHSSQVFSGPPPVIQQPKTHENMESSRL